MYCHNCGTKNDDENQFCIKCGEALKKPSKQQISQHKSQYSGMACHEHGCTNPVIGQCTGYKTSCLRFYCEEHSIESWCSVCVNKFAHDLAVKEIFQEYLEKAIKIDSAAKINFMPGIIGGLFFIFIGPALSTSIDNIGYCSAIISFIAGIALIWGAISGRSQKNKLLHKESIETPGFIEFYDEYERQKKADNMQKILTGVLVAGAASVAIQQYQARQDIHEIAKKMK